MLNTTCPFYPRLSRGRIKCVILMEPHKTWVSKSSLLPSDLMLFLSGCFPRSLFLTLEKRANNAQTKAPL